MSGPERLSERKAVTEVLTARDGMLRPKDKLHNVLYLRRTEIDLKKKKRHEDGNIETNIWVCAI